MSSSAVQHTSGHNVSMRSGRLTSRRTIAAVFPRGSGRTRDAPDQMPALIGIRLPLALWVVAHHISGPGRMLNPVIAESPALYALIESAWVALTAFFAISGFVLARRYRTTAWSRDALARFAAARFGRIYPVYFLSLLILLPIMWEAMRQDDIRSLTERTGLLLNYVLLLQGWH